MRFDGGPAMVGRRAALAATLALAAAPTASLAQAAWPSRAVRIVVPYAAGGGTDVTTRAMAEALSARFGQPFVVENRPGANGVVGTEGVARSAPDGQTLLAVTSTHVMNRQVVQPLPYDPATDFTPVAMLARYPLVLIANVDAPFKDVPGLIRHAKGRPGEVAQATSDAQGAYAAAQFAQAAGIQLTDVPYRGSGAYLGDLTGGHLKLAWGSTATVMPLLPAGRVRVIAVTSPERSAYLPDSPTVAELGLPSVGFVGWFGLYGPARLPRPIASQLNRAITEITATPAMQERFRTLGVEAWPMDLEALSAVLRDEEDRWARAAAAGLLPKP